MIGQFKFRLALLLAVALSCWSGQSAVAGIVSVDAVQSRIPVSATGPSPATVTWRVVRDAGSGPTFPNPGTVSSSQGRFLINSVVVGTVNRTLSRTNPGSDAFPDTLVFTETILVPQAVIFRAVKSGQPIVFERTFNDSNPLPPPDTGTGSTTLAPSGPGSAAFGISRLSLSFDDQSRVKVLPRNGRARAVAELSVSGTGLVEARWEVATSATTAGSPVFQILAVVRQPALGGRLVITSPPLPTRFAGNNLVRLRITDPETFFDEPVLQYYVTPDSPLPDQRAPGLLLTTAPTPGTPLTLTTRFAWQAVPGAQAYKLEVFPAPPGPAEPLSDEAVTTPVPLEPAPDTSALAGLEPLTGAVVPGTQTEIRLQSYSLAHLPGDRRYLWTVTALDPEGARLGVSPPREIYKP